MKTFKPLGGAGLQFFVFPPNVLLRVRREGQEPRGAARRGVRGHAAGPELGLHRGQRPHQRGQRRVPATGRQPAADDTSHRGVFRFFKDAANFKDPILTNTHIFQMLIQIFSSINPNIFKY